MRLSDLQDAARRFYDLQPGELPALSVHPGILLTQDIARLADEGRGSRTYSLRTTQGAVAAEYQAISLELPAGAPAVTCQILEVRLWSNATDMFYFGPGTSVTSVDRGAGYALDMRNLSSGYRSAAHLRDESSAAPLLTAMGELHSVTTGIASAVVFRPESMFVRAGILWTFRTAGLNAGLSGMITWRESGYQQRP